MFESMSYLFLQHYWWFIISLLGSVLAFLLFVQGGQTLLFTIGKNETERTMLVNVLGRKWEYTFTTLVTFGGAFFASFPLFYSTSFGGAYWVWIIILFAFVLQAVSYEFRVKPGNFLGQRTYETFLFINGVVGTVLLGTAIATFFTGSQFSVDFNNLTNLSNPVISQWQSPYRGLEAAVNIHNLSLGFAVFFLARLMAILYFQKNIDHAAMNQRMNKHLLRNSSFFLVCFLSFIIWLMIRPGFGYSGTSDEIVRVDNKYLINLLEMPAVMILFLLGVAGVLFGIIRNLFYKASNGILFSGTGTVLTVLSLFLLAGYNHTSFYPSVYDLQSSLTIQNSSSSKYTLVAMSYVSLFVPVVITYIYFAWRSINNKKMDEKEIHEDAHY